MCDYDGKTKLIVKGLLVICLTALAALRPGILEVLFNYRIAGAMHVFHILWALTVFILLKRMIPGLNSKMTSGKVFLRNYIASNDDSEKRRRAFVKEKKRADSGAVRSGLYWFLLLSVMWMWRTVGILPDIWIYVIVVFFIFMDQFCVSVFCPFQWLMMNKCCNTCRINNWGYCMAFSPLIFIDSVWTYSIVLISFVAILHWEYLYYRHPERFSEWYNQRLACRNCTTDCTRKSRLKTAGS